MIGGDCCYGSQQLKKREYKKENKLKVIIIIKKTVQ